MLVVRLKRIGKKNKPTYRVVVAENSSAVNGPYVQDLGYYDPHTKNFSIDKDAVTGWFDKGAKPSNTVARLLEKEKVLHKSIVVIKHVKAPKKKVEEKPATGQVATVQPESTETASEPAIELETPVSDTSEVTAVEEPAVVETHEVPVDAEPTAEAPVDTAEESTV